MGPASDRDGRTLSTALVPPAWSHLEADGSRARIVLSVLSLLSLLAFFWSIQAYLSPPSGDDASGTTVDRGGRKLFVLVVDALNPRVVDTGQLPFLEPFLETGFRAEVEPCTDRLTIPCLRDAFTGVSSFGLFGAFDNLVAAKRLSSSNLFRDLREDGRSSAGIAHGELDQFEGWLDFYYKGKDELRAVAAAFEEGHDLVIYHYIWLDLVTHRAPIGSPPFDQALHHLDQTATQILEHMPDEYDFVVLGDHGHDERGRHIQGLDVPTIFLSSGQLLGSRTIEERIPITTYRYLLGAKLGIVPPPSYEGTDIAPWLPSESPIREAAETVQFSPRSARAGIPWLPLAASLLLPALTLRALPGGPKGLILGLLGAAAAFLSGTAYPWLVATIHFNLNLPDFPRYLPHAILGLGVVGWLITKRPTATIWLLVAAGLMLPQTLYRYGLYQRVVPLAVVGILLLLLPEDLVRSVRQARWREVARTLGIVAAILLLARFLVPVYVMNFAIRGFMGLDRLLTFAPGGLPLAFWAFPVICAGLVASVARSEDRLRWILAAIAAIGVLVTGFGALPAWGAIALTAACVVAFHTSTPVPLFLLASWLLPFFLRPSPAYGVVLSLLFVLAAIAVPCEASTRRRWMLAALTAGMAYFATGFSSGLRANGLDYQFALDWLPGRLAEDLWFLVGAALLVKVLLPAGLLSHAVHRFAPDAKLRPAIELVVSARLAACSLFVVGFLTTVDELPRFRLLEICEDMIGWTFLLFVFALAPFRSPDRREVPEAP